LPRNTMHRFFVSPADIDDTIALTGENARHFAVLRIRAGEEIIICNGAGLDYFCHAIEIGRDKVIARVLRVCENTAELPIAITLFQGLPKADKLEIVIQKAIELGVHKIAPIFCQNSIPKISNAANKIQRLQKIAESAAKQSGRGIIPMVEDCISFDKGLEMAKNLDLSYICHPAKNAIFHGAFLRGKLGNISSLGIFIGPEGGFCESEAAALPNISLGRGILRTETAAIAAIANIVYELEV